MVGALSPGRDRHRQAVLLSRFHAQDLREYRLGRRKRPSVAVVLRPFSHVMGHWSIRKDGGPERIPKTLHILIADDQPSFRHTLREMMQAEPSWFVVTGARNGLEAIEQVKRHRPDVVLMDMVMPVMDGIEAMERIKEIAPQTRVIAMTAYDNAEFPKRSLEAGADCFLKKEELNTATLQECLEQIQVTKPIESKGGS